MCKKLIRSYKGNFCYENLEKLQLDIKAECQTTGCECAIFRNATYKIVKVEDQNSNNLSGATAVVLFFWSRYAVNIFSRSQILFGDTKTLENVAAFSGTELIFILYCIAVSVIRYHYSGRLASRHKTAGGTLAIDLLFGRTNT